MAAGIFLYRESDGRFLLQKRDKAAARLPGYWGFFGGAVEKGESPEQAAIREAKEELDIDVADPILLLEESFFDPDLGNAKKYIFLVKFIPSMILKLNEGEAMEWFSFNEIEGLLLVDHDRNSLLRISEKIEQLFYSRIKNKKPLQKQ